MTIRIILSCLLCFFCSTLCAEQRASRQSNFIASYAASWENARNNFEDCSSGHVKNHFILGECPSNRSIDIYYLTSMLAVIGAKKVLPHQYAKYLDNSRYNLNLSYQHNYSKLGVRFSY